jgi:hypothetical protein
LKVGSRHGGDCGRDRGEIIAAYDLYIPLDRFSCTNNA